MRDLLGDLTEAYAVPGEGSIIDLIIPDTGLTWINRETEEEIKARYPNAERVNFAAWCAEKAARQDTPVVWHPTTREQYVDMRDVLPPEAYAGGGRAFLVGEPCDHHATSGAPRFRAYWYRDGEYFVSDRPLTVAEFGPAVRATAEPSVVTASQRERRIQERRAAERAAALAKE